MSAKTSTLSSNTSTAPNTSTAMASSPAHATTNASALGVVKIKKELPTDEIGEYAEHTMNEMLGWYGYDDVNQLDLSVKTSRLLQSAMAAAAVSVATSATSSALRQQQQNSAANHHHQQQHQQQQQQQQQQHHLDKRRNRNRAMTLLHLQQQQSEHLQNIRNNNNNSLSSSNNNNNNASKKGATNNCHNYRSKSSAASASATATAVLGSGMSAGPAGACTDSTASDHDTHSSREDDSKSPQSLENKTTVSEEKFIDYNNCCWCRRPVPENGPEFLTTTDGPRYCSEACFAQSRRASFKKAKTCDWCKHVRHAVSYVDFQDGASQLQFCSDKCLNQYKMQIFCKETQAHLDMNPHLRDQALEAAAASNGGLITPDLWLRNCRSRSISPASTKSLSPVRLSPTARDVTPPHSAAAAAASVRRDILADLGATSAVGSAAEVTSSSHKPLISVAPVAKLMSKSASAAIQTRQQTSVKALVQQQQQQQQQQHHHHHHQSRKKRPLRACAAADHHTSPPTLKSGGGGHHPSATVTRDSLAAGSKSKSSLMVGNATATTPLHAGGGGKTTASSLSQFAAASVQDLHMSVPPLSPMLEQVTAPSLPPPPTSALHHHHALSHQHSLSHSHQHPHHHLHHSLGGSSAAASSSSSSSGSHLGGSGGQRAAGGLHAASFFGLPNLGHPVGQPPTGYPSRAPPPPPAFLPPANPALLPSSFLGGGGFPGLPLPKLSSSSSASAHAPGLTQQAPPLPPAPPPQQLPHMLHPTTASLSAALLGAPPPVTVMVPYPIIIPLPFPIPVPIPIIDFYRAYLKPEERRKMDEMKRSPAAGSASGTATPQPAPPQPPPRTPTPSGVHHQEQETKKEIFNAADPPLNGEKEEESTSALPTAGSEEPLDFTKTKEFTHHTDSPPNTNHIHHRETSASVANDNYERRKRLAMEDDDAVSIEMYKVERKLSGDTPPLPAPPNAHMRSSPRAASPTRSPSFRVEESTSPSAHASGERNMNGLGCQGDGEETQEKLPKLKITRLQTKRTLITQTSKEAEYSRPLRKRKRIIDCDFQKILLKEMQTPAGEDQDQEVSEQAIEGANVIKTDSLEESPAGEETMNGLAATAVCNNNNGAKIQPRK